jgi:hypothetical protein
VESVDDVWAIGNGISRQNFQLKKIQGWTIGCNAIHRDYRVNEIVAVDRRMVTEIMGNEEYAGVPIYTRQSWMVFFKHLEQIRTVPELPYTGHNKHDMPDHWNSGPYAVLLAVLKQPQTVNLLGFDLYGIGKTYNNLYMNTPNYGKGGDRPVGHSFWVVQLAKIFELNPNIEFIQWQRPNWQNPFQWKSIKNLTIKEIPV